MLCVVCCMGYNLWCSRCAMFDVVFGVLYAVCGVLCAMAGVRFARYCWLYTVYDMVCSVHGMLYVVCCVLCGVRCALFDV